MQLTAKPENVKYIYVTMIKKLPLAQRRLMVERGGEKILGRLFHLFFCPKMFLEDEHDYTSLKGLL